MIGGMEDEERERRQREWDEWRAEQNKIWWNQQIRAANRRERDNIKRGYWGLTEPLTTDEDTIYITSMTLTTGKRSLLLVTKNEWKLKGPNGQQRYDELYKNTKRTKAASILPKPEYILESTTNVGIG
jgi:hypothetical protein